MARHTFFCIDGHTCGNPVRVVGGGSIPQLKGETMFDRRQHFLAEYDWIRTGLMFEPRGHDMMSGSILYPPTRPDCDVGILFIETSGCLPMCGHGTIGTVTIALENGLIHPKTPGLLRLDTPAGVVEARYEQNGPFVERVRITNIPSFLYGTGYEVEVEGLGHLTVDVAYGGNFYAIVEPQALYSDLSDVEPVRHPALEPQAARSVQRALQDRASREPGHRPPDARALDWKGPESGRHGAQCGVLRRQGHRPLALRHGHLRPHGASRRPRRLEAKAMPSFTRASSARPSRAASKGARRWATAMRSSRPSKAGRG